MAVTAPVGVATGGLSGIGAATAQAFARLHAKLVLVDRVTDAATDVVAGVVSEGGEAVIVEADVRDAAAMERVAATALKRFGRIDFVVANAGVADQSSITDGNPDRWRAVLETNVLGALFTLRAALRPMLDAGRGHVFIVASISGRETYVGEPAYIASKWAQVGLAHALREEAQEAGVRVTVVEPGLVDTPLTRESPAVRPLLDAIEPLTPEDVAGALVYAWGQPPHVVVSEVAIRPLRQRLPRFGPDG